MRKIYYLVVCALISMSFTKDAITKDLEKWLSKNSDKSKIINTKFAKRPLNKTEAENASNILWKSLTEDIKKQYQRDWDDKKFEQEGLIYKFEYKVFGEKPADGRSLYISMHGGGNAPAQVNEQQWRNQINLYQPQEGIYLSPRAPWDDWNMWFKPGLDEFFDRTIFAATVLMDVNPDKVYLLGYSAGGDGAYRMGPRMADRWAAASMMAGHPGEASMVNLRNVPYMIWMGENDAAYDRNTLAIKFGQILDSLQSADSQGYIHETHIVKGKGHWMDREDKVAVDWMSKYKRNPIPNKVVWRQEEVLHNQLYWLQIPIEDAKHQLRLVAEYQDNTITILETDYKKFTILLNDNMMNLDNPVKVIYNGKVLFDGKVSRTVENIYDSLEKRKDKGLIFSARIEINL